MSAIGVVTAHLGTPQAPTASAVRPYLRQFLSDRRVVDYPPLLWQVLLNLVILAVRPARSARLYRRIWTEQGSPLMMYAQRQAAGLQTRLGDRYRVVLGMTYGQMGIPQAIRQLEAEGIDRILVFPMYPQFSSTTTGSVYDAAYLGAAGRTGFWRHDRKRSIPTLRFVPPFADHPGYIEALARRIEETAGKAGKTPDKYLFSFHGIPERYARTGDPYPDQCKLTARLLAEHLKLGADQWAISFQSRFGPEPWLRPYTDSMLEGLYVNGVRSVLVACPSFTTDCLETLDEIGHEGREQFVSGGGSAENYLLAPCLNDHPLWLDTMAEIASREAQGWVS